MQARSGTDILGADVSHYQGAIDWPMAARAGLQFVFIKASEGVGMIDAQLRRNAFGADAVSIPVGFYHYAHPELNNAVAEAAAFMDAIAGLPYKLPLMLDVEGRAGDVPRTQLTEWCDTFLQEVQRRTGARVGIYTGAYFARDNLGPQLGKYPLWVAHYGRTTPLANSTWPKWAVFQYSESGSCPGIGSGNVDMNVMDADLYNAIMNPPVAEEPKEEPEMQVKHATLLIGLAKAAWREGVTKIELEDGSMQEITEQDIEVAADAARVASGQPVQ